MLYDVIIVGAGPAGMTAAVYAARKKMNILLITPDIGGQMLWTMRIENYMGYQYINGPELVAKFEEQVKQFPLSIHYEEVKKITRTEQGMFVVEAEHTYQSRAVILASGKRPRLLQVPGELEFVGRGVSYCATCDGPLFEGKVVAVIGGGNSGVQAAVELSTLAKQVLLVVREGYQADPIILDKLRQARNVKYYVGYEVVEIEGEDFVQVLNLRNRDTHKLISLKVEGIFVEIGLIPNSEYVQELVERNSVDEIIVNCRAQTSIPGLFAAGDVTSSPDKQIVIAAGDGAKAALLAYEYLLRNQ